MSSVKVLICLMVLATLNLSNAVYCGNDGYDQTSTKCICGGNVCCKPGLYPSVCCQNASLPTTGPFEGSWILTDTKPSPPLYDAFSPLNITFLGNYTYQMDVHYNLPIASGFPNDTEWATHVLVPVGACPYIGSANDSFNSVAFQLSQDQNSLTISTFYMQATYIRLNDTITV